MFPKVIWLIFKARLVSVIGYSKNGNSFAISWMYGTYTSIYLYLIVFFKRSLRIDFWPK